MDFIGRCRKTGFTLIELMIVVAILGILMSIAVPAYNEYIRRGHRAAAQQFLLDIAQRQEQYLLDNRQYATALGPPGTPGSLGMTMPGDVATYYNPPDFTGVNNAATPPLFVLFISPRAGTMASDGNLVVNNNAQKWRDTDGDNVYTSGTDKAW